jgi:hypothetical protein
MQEAAQDVFRHHVSGDPGGIGHGHAVRVPVAEMVDPDATIATQRGPPSAKIASRGKGPGSNRTV